MGKKYNHGKVSILVAVYNVEQYIGKCIESIIHQEYQNLEIILVDDHSTDHSGEICEEYAGKDSRITVIHHERNTRLPGVRNTGLDRATGKYIVFVDGDDWLASDYVTYLLRVIMETGSDMGINLVNYTTRETRQGKEKEITVWSAEKATAELLFPHLTIGAWNKIYQRDFIERFHLRFHEKAFTAEGYWFINEAAQRANHIGVGCRKVYYYRLNNLGSATTKYDIRQSEGALSVLSEIEKGLIIRTPYVMNALRQHIWLNQFWNLRQITALHLRDQKKDSYLCSIRYLRKHAFSVAKGEPVCHKKIKYCITGMFPVLAAKIKNFLFEWRLKRDFIRYRKEEESTIDEMLKGDRKKI